MLAALGNIKYLLLSDTGQEANWINRLNIEKSYLHFGLASHDVST